VLHAYVIMGDNFHLALKTPEGNLAAGICSGCRPAFTIRCNRVRGQAGHGSIFQGRYKALPVQAANPPGASIARKKSG